MRGQLLCGSHKEPVADSCKYNYELSGSIKGGEFCWQPERLSDSREWLCSVELVRAYNSVRIWCNSNICFSLSTPLDPPSIKRCNECWESPVTLATDWHSTSLHGATTRRQPSSYSPPWELEILAADLDQENAQSKSVWNSGLKWRLSFWTKIRTKSN
jgi:hypothetical protein